MNAEAEAAEPGFTIYDLHTADSPRRPQELPRLVAAALRIVGAAGPREAATATVLQIVGGLGTGVMVLLSKRVLDGVVAAGPVRPVGRAPMVVFGLATVGMSLTGAIGSLLALLALQPVLVPLAALVIVPATLLTSQRGEAFYRFAFAMTPRDRERAYLASLLTGREPAKEVRAFGLVEVLRGRHDRLAAERAAELRRVARRQLRYGLLANLASAAITGGTLALLVALALEGRMTLVDAAAAAAAIVLLGQRLVYGSGWRSRTCSSATRRS